MKRNIQLTLAFAIICMLNSCGTIFTKMYGMKKVRPVDEKEMIRYAGKFKIPADAVYELDTSYVSFLLALDSVKYADQKKNHYQPLQALYYDKSGQLVSFHINCYCGGFPNLNWDRNNCMAAFPPGQQAPVDSIVPLFTQFNYLKPLPYTQPFSIMEYDYVLVVYWSRFMGRQSKRLIQTVQENSKLAGNKRVRIIYANNDNIFARD
jgi:hypothetical protein